MAANIFSAARQAEPVRAQLKTVLTALRKILDELVSYRMRLAASQAEHVLRGSPAGRHHHRKMRNQ
jgi:hypothetical protein